jgi:hypothetical protein
MSWVFGVSVITNSPAPVHFVAEIAVSWKPQRLRSSSGWRNSTVSV